MSSDNVFRIMPEGTITEIVDGDGNLLETPYDVAVDAAGDVYVTGQFSHNAFWINLVPLFADGFESGDLTRWSDAAP